MGEVRAKIGDLKPDSHNANRGTKRGVDLLQKSLEKFGAGRSVLLDKNNRIIAGNKTVEQAADLGLDDVEIIESDGRRIIAVKRTDIDLDTPEGREMALADNRTSEIGLDWDTEELAEWDDVDLGEWWFEDELEELGLADEKPKKEVVEQNFGEEWMIIVVCHNEEQQFNLLERFMEEGLECRALVS